MSTLDVARAELALTVLYLNKAEARDKICRAIQYGSKFLSDGKPGTAQNVDKSTSLARKVFRLFKVWFGLVILCLILPRHFYLSFIFNFLFLSPFLCVILSYVNALFSCLQFVNDLTALISPPAKGTPLSLVLLGKVLVNSLSAILM